MNRWGKAIVVSALAMAVGACTAAPKKVATTAPVSTQAPVTTQAPPTINVQPTVLPGETRTVAAIGTGTISVRPDTMIASVGISVTRGTIDQATNKVASLVSSVKKVVVANGGSSSDVSANGSSIYFYKNGAASNYTFSETLTIRLRNNEAANRLLAKIVTALGGNSNSGVNTTLVSSDEDEFYAQARKAAIADAKKAASAWAALAGLTIGKIQSVAELAPAAQNAPGQALGGGYGYQTPTDGSVIINKGAFTYTVRVSVVYAIK